MGQSNRLDELDSLRGLAATSVVLSHFLGVIPIYLVILLTNSPLHIFWAGHESVILFFILSGFVLSLPYHNNKVIKYKNYLIKRFCRLYFPYLTSILISILFLILIPRVKAPGLSGWFNGVAPPITIRQLINHFFSLGYFQSASYNLVIWSLIHEMRISIIFPLLMYFVIKIDWKKIISIGISFSILCLLIWYFCLKIFNYNIVKFDTSYLLTFHYLSFFMVGALLAKNIHIFHNTYTKISKVLKIFILIIAVLAYTYSWWFFHNVFFLHFQYIDDWIIAFGCSIFIIFTINSEKIKRIMLFKPIHFIGKISYSLYLFHIPVLLSVVNALYGKLPIPVILVGAFILSFIIASLMYYTIETPSIKLGKILSNSITKVDKEYAAKNASA